MIANKLAIKNHFIEQLPKRPYYSNDYEFGLRIAKKENVLGFNFLQHNKPHLVSWIVLDIDRPNVIDEIMEDRTLPKPNFVVINRKNGNSHIFYAISPVLKYSHKTSPAGLYKALALLSLVQYSLTDLFKADPQYNNNVSKNPLNNEKWISYTLSERIWDLKDFKEYVDLPDKLPKKAQDKGYGRNCTLFENIRLLAYDNVEQFRTKQTLEKFNQFVLNEAENFNRNNFFYDLLPLNEVKSTAKSIAEWTWRNYKVVHSNGYVKENWADYVKRTHNSEAQAYRNKLRRNKTNAGRKANVVKEWDLLGISRSTYFRRKNNKNYK